ncbi:MAG TPA: hypothetical protein VIZ90_05305 [Rhizobiaceae bacterium]
MRRHRGRWAGTMSCLMVAIAAGFALHGGEAHAINRYTSTSKTCSQVKAIISREGAAIMQHRSPRTGLPLYDRYVKNRLFCPAGQTTDRAYIPTSDLPACPVNRCEDIQFFDMR